MVSAISSVSEGKFRNAMLELQVYIPTCAQVVVPLKARLGHPPKQPLRTSAKEIRGGGRDHRDAGS